MFQFLHLLLTDYSEICVKYEQNWLKVINKYKRNLFTDFIRKYITISGNFFFSTTGAFAALMDDSTNPEIVSYSPFYSTNIIKIIIIIIKTRPTQKY